MFYVQQIHFSSYTILNKFKVFATIVVLKYKIVYEFFIFFFM